MPKSDSRISSGEPIPKQRLTLAKTPFVAVRAYQLKASEVPGLTIRMALGRLPNEASYSPDLLENAGNVPVEFLLIFDQRTGQLAAPDGILIIGSPSKESSGNLAGCGQSMQAADGGRSASLAREKPDHGWPIVPGSELIAKND